MTKSEENNLRAVIAAVLEEAFSNGMFDDFKC